MQLGILLISFAVQYGCADVLQSRMSCGDFLSARARLFRQKAPLPSFVLKMMNSERDILNSDCALFEDDTGEAWREEPQSLVEAPPTSLGAARRPIQGELPRPRPLSQSGRSPNARGPHGPSSLRTFVREDGLTGGFVALNRNDRASPASGPSSVASIASPSPSAGFVSPKRKAEEGGY